jgi:hypothetical protein
MITVDEKKYVVFKRDEFLRLLRDSGILAENLDVHDHFKDAELHDAVVIRRQDHFASPCLLTYAAMISMVAQHHPERIQKDELLAIADYFHEQGVLAGDEGYKLPTL